MSNKKVFPYDIPTSHDSIPLESQVLVYSVPANSAGKYPVSHFTSPPNPDTGIGRLFLKEVFHDDSLVGKGTIANPLRIPIPNATVTLDKTHPDGWFRIVKVVYGAIWIYMLRPLRNNTSSEKTIKDADTIAQAPVDTITIPMGIAKTNLTGDVSNYKSYAYGIYSSDGTVRFHSDKCDASPGWHTYLDFNMNL